MEYTFENVFVDRKGFSLIISLTLRDKLKLVGLFLGSITIVIHLPN